MKKTRAGDVVGVAAPVQRIYRRAQLPAVTGLSINIYNSWRGVSFPDRFHSATGGWLG